MADMTNAYISQGVDGGLLTMTLFVLIIVLCFRDLGKSLQVMENESIVIRITLWSMGVVLFAHVVSFISVSYYDQTIVFWFLLLSMISTATSLGPSNGENECDTLTIE